MLDGINEEEAARFLDEKDRESGINQVEPVLKEVEVNPNNLGIVASYSELNELSGASESSWKILDTLGLPSGGMFYPEGSELLLRPAKTKEIRHWSTID